MANFFTRVALAGIFSLGTLSADVIFSTYEAPGAQIAIQPNAEAACVGQTPACVFGSETFDSWNGGDFSTDFGTGGIISALYSGGMSSFAADQFGGAGGVGRYIETLPGNSYTVTLSHNGAIPGINYVGLWYSALDVNSFVSLYRGDVFLGTFTPSAYVNLVGPCPSGSNPYCGNPNPNFQGQNDSQQYAFLSFYDTDGYFDKIVFEQVGTGGFESDNHSFAFLNPVTGDGTLITPEPATWWFVLGGALFLLPAATRRRKA